MVVLFKNLVIFILIWFTLDHKADSEEWILFEDWFVIFIKVSVFDIKFFIIILILLRFLNHVQLL